MNKVEAQTSGSYQYAPGLVLTGSNYQDVASSTSLQLSQFSVAAWFKTSSNFGSDAFIVNKGGIGSDSSGQNLNYGIWMNSGEQIKAGFETSSGADQYVTSPSTYNNGQWHYVMVTNDGSTVRLYIDGVQVATKSTSGASPETSGTKPVRVGANSRVTPPGNFFTGEVDEVRVWNDDLTTQQVADAFSGSSFNTGEQVLHLPFGSNSLPVANNQNIIVTMNTPRSITLVGTDSNNDDLEYIVVTQPTHGTITGGTTPSRTYTPGTDYVGSDSFTFRVNDGTTDSNTATVSITVQQPAQSGSYNYSPSLALTGSNYQDVASSTSLQLSQFSVAAWFKTSSNFRSDAVIANKGGVGSDSSGENMNYGIWMTSTEKIKAGFETSSGADQYVTSPSTYNNGQWHYVMVTNDGSTVRLYIDGVQVATKSTSGASPETSGTKPVRVGANSRVTPPGNFFTGEVDEVRIWNDDLTTQQVADAFAGTVNTVGQVLHLSFGSNSPPVANNQAINVNKNTQQAIILTATDPNNDALTYTLSTQPAHGTLTGTAPNLNYNPDTDYVGPDSFTFKVNDGTTDSNIATVSITVQGPANDPPVANNQAITINKNTQQAITLTATDPNNDPLTYTVLTQPAHGTLTGTAPNLNYNPDTDYVGPDSFTFSANDGIVDSSTATVSITVEDVSSCTTILPMSGITASGYQLGNPPSNAIDADLSTRWANDGVGSWISADLGATQNICSVDIAWYSGNTRQYHFVIATSTDGNTFTNVFNSDSSGTTLSSEKYTISDINARYVRVTVNGNTQNNWASIYDFKIFGSTLSGNSPPVATNQAVTTSKNIAKDITLTASDLNNDPLNYSIVTQPAHGTLTGTAPNLNYNPDTDYVGADSFTFKANDGTTDGNTATISITVDDPSKDQFGIIKLYATKNNGEEWFINMDNPIGDSRFNPQNTITKNPDGSWKMKATQVRMNVYTSTGYNSANIPTLDHSVIASKGYMLASNDWRNFEMTQYVKVNTSPSDDNFSPYGRGGRHTGSGAPEGCEGSSTKGDVFFSGKVRFAKEQWHVSYVFTNLKTATSSIEDKWVGIKFIVYNFVENNKVVVKTELWLDINNNGNFVKYDENLDRGGWGTEGVECGGAPDQIISWGGPITTFRWDTATDVDFKNLSVREIIPPQ